MLNNTLKFLSKQADFQRVSPLVALLKNNYATEAKFETKPFKLHKLEQGPSTTVTVSKDEAIKFYKQMQTIRRLETAAGNLYKEKIVRGFCHLYSGQEACAVGMKSAMRDHDSIISAYRVHGWAYLMGVPVLGVLAELAGRKSGCARGKGGSMHMYAPNFYGGNGVVGAQVPLGVGVAFASKYLGKDEVCFTLYGDGAANQGQVFEAYNIAKLLGVPCIFVCENNGYGMGTSAERASANMAYYTRADYIPGIWIDGMDVLSVKSASQFAVDYCKAGKGPILMEAATYRYSGHSMSDPGTSYRTREEVQKVRQTSDPISSFKEKILTSGLVTAEEITKFDAEIKTEVDAAMKKARSDTEIGIDELVADVYVESYGRKIRGILPWQKLDQKRIGPAGNI